MFDKGTRLDLGTITFSDQDIIEFASRFDPLPFHLDAEAAKKSVFKGLIASGPHIFNHTYRNLWLPLYGRTIICGMGVYNWKFIRPIYSGQPIRATATILETRKDSIPGAIAVMWQFDFRNTQNELVQTLQTEVMHRPD